MTRKRTGSRRGPSSANGDDGNARPQGRQPSQTRAPEAKQHLDCGLYVVSTPIGNLEDMTFRAVSVLKAVDRIACEDTRVTGKLLKHFGIQTPMLSYNDHNGAKVRPRLMTALQDGQSVALVSDAGTPLLSDPGLKLVQACWDSGFTVSPIPGASAMLAGLVTAGLPTDRVLFAGFLPSKAKARQTALRDLAAVQATVVFYETGPRLAPCLSDMAAQLGPRPAAIGRELTKRYEEVTRHPLDQLARQYADSPAPKGELVVVVGPPDKAGPIDPIDLDAELRHALQTESVRDAASRVAEKTGLARRDVYARALVLSSGSSGD